MDICQGDEETLVSLSLFAEKTYSIMKEERMEIP